MDWTLEEVEAVVSDYLEMLQLEIVGTDYNKAERNRALQKLTGRSKGSIEFKHQNISAVLIELGMPYIEGYKPRFNYQNLLRRSVESRLSSSNALVASVEKAVMSEVQVIPEVDWDSMWTEAPKTDICQVPGFAKRRS